MNKIGVDVVVVVHNEWNKKEAARLRAELVDLADLPFSIVTVDNSVNNRGFAAACNLGAAALRKNGVRPVLAFINPDAMVMGPFMQYVEKTFAADPDVVITGSRFGKPDYELATWGVKNWVCGAAFFVRRDWFDQVGGFDQRFVWSFEETDLCRLAESQGRKVKSIEIPILHSSPTKEPHADTMYKQKWIQEGWLRYQKKWGQQ